MNIMRTIHKVGLLAACVLTAASLVGCSTVCLPPAEKGYTVHQGGSEFYAKSVKLHGGWAELETDGGTVWANGVVIRPVK
jgi:hypothetical protein